MKYFKGKSKKIEISGPMNIKTGNNALRNGYRMTQEKYEKNLVDRESKKPKYKGIPGYNIPLPKKFTRRKIGNKRHSTIRRRNIRSALKKLSTKVSNNVNLKRSKGMNKREFQPVYASVKIPKPPQVPSKMKRFSHNNALRICTGLSKKDCDKHDINCKFTSKCIPKAPPKTMKKLRKFSKTKSTKRVRFTDSTKSSNA